MPSAKIVTRDRLPPENMSYRPNIVFCICRASSASAAMFTPGIGDVVADAVHASMPSVNSTRLRRSETVKMFFRLSFTRVAPSRRPPPRSSPPPSR